MAARLALLAPRLVALVVIWLLAAASWTLAASAPQPAEPVVEETEERPEPVVLVVPDVRSQAYVFAKGILQDAGFAWRAEGPVRGYAANIVVSQTPAPGVRVIDNGAPTVVLSLKRSGDYAERGVPENESPYRGTSVVLLADWRAKQAANPVEEEQTTPAPTEPTATEPQPEPEPEPAPEKDPAYREPDFVVEGAPREPADEIPLPARARRLEQRLAGPRKPGPRLIDHWLYQHNWIVTGARFGWKDGDVALRRLIRIDRSLQQRFGFGAHSEVVARRALAYVEEQKR